MSISKQAHKMFDLKSSVSLMLGKSESTLSMSKYAVSIGQKMRWLDKDGVVKEVCPEGVISAVNSLLRGKTSSQLIIDDPLKNSRGVYAIRHRMYVRTHPTKKRGNFVEVITHVRGWKLTNKMSKKYNAEMVRVA